MRQLTHALLAIGIAGSMSCSSDDDDSTPVQESEVLVQRLRSAPSATSASTMLAMDFVATDATGAAIPCDDASLQLDVAISFDGSSFTPVDAASVVSSCQATVPYDVAIVVDNSGSQEDVLTHTRDGARAFATDVVGAGGRVSVVRVSTFSSVLAPLTADLQQVNDALDSMFVNDGWTSLYDGIRKGNETLGEVLGSSSMSSFGTPQEFCNQNRGFAVVAFTNGNDNNSSEQELGGLESDGIDTTLDDLLDLQVNSVKTPVHTIGLGKRLNTALLTDLAGTTGGRHIPVQTAADVPNAFDLLGDYAGATTQVCAETPVGGCGQATVRVGYTYTPAGQPATQGTKEYAINVPCPAQAPSGKTVTMLMTMSDPGIPQATAQSLATNAVNYVSPVAQPNVLFVRDDNHHGEDSGDVQFVEGLVAQSGIATTYETEPNHGYAIGAFANYDVVYFSNPGWPLDDATTMQALQDFVANGGGLVLVGDDMSWSMGNAFPMTPLTQLIHGNNGTQTCGVKTDDNQGQSYRVTLEPSPHPVLAGVAGDSFTYGNDIDHSTPAGAGEVVLAWAELDGDPNCAVRTPVIVAYEP